MFIGREKELALLQQDYIGKAVMVYASTMSVGLFLVIAILSVFAFRAMQSKGAAYDD